MTEQDNLFHLTFGGRTADFVSDNESALERLICILAELQSGVVTLDLQKGSLLAANITHREYFVG